jgi:outer membrane protein assembly factor BamE
MRFHFILVKGKKMILRLMFAFSMLWLTSCVYVLEIQQGNLINQKEINQLRPQLTKEQVVFVLGNPVIDDSFSDDKWIYMNTYKNRDGVKTTQKLELYFKKGLLVQAKGDYTIPKLLQ